MSEAISAWVPSLGDFPLDPDSGRAWLWSGGGDRLLWASESAREGLSPDADVPADPQLVRSFAPLMALAHPDREPIRVHQLALGGSQPPPIHTCLCRHVPLKDGTYGLLAVAIGAPARSMDEVRGEPPSVGEPASGPVAGSEPPSDAPVAAEVRVEEAPQEIVAAAPDAPVVSSPHVDGEAAARPEAGSDISTEDEGVTLGSEAQPGAIASQEPPGHSRPPADAEPEPEPEPEPDGQDPTPIATAPAWIATEPEDRIPLRFVWQTDEFGRFVHISRELAEAVGAANALVIGRTWTQSAEAFGLEEWEAVEAGFRSGETWTAAPVLWPVASADRGVPVEMAGLKVLEAGRFEGFRGYGIARIERAVARPQSAAQALAVDEDATTDSADGRFGPSAAGSPGPGPRDLRRVTAPSDPSAPSELVAIGADPSGERPSGTLAPLGDQDPATAGHNAAGEFVPETALVDGIDEQDASSDASGTEIAAYDGGDRNRDGLEAAPPIQAQQKAPPLAESSAEASPLDAAELGAVAGPAPGEPAARPPDRPHAAASEGDEAAASRLSRIEREAFREIARTLAVMTGAQEAATTTAIPPARRDIRPLEIIPHDSSPASRPQEQSAELQPAIQTPTGPIVSHEEVQARRERRQIQQPSRTLDSSILNALPIGLVVAQGGDTLFVNKALLELSGYADLEALLAAGGTRALFGDGAGEPTADATQFTLAARSGERIAVDASVEPVTWENASALLTTVRRAAEPKASPRQKALEIELASAQAELREFRSVLDTATDGVILLDGEGRILSLNRSAEALFGLDQNEIAGERLTVLLDPESHMAALDYLDGLKSNGVNSILNDGRDVKGRERNGGAIPLFMTIGRIDEGVTAAKFCAVLRDVTHWKKVEADLIEAKRAAEDANAHKSDFLARISHEIRTPLNAITGFSQVMMSESFGPIGSERYKQYVKDIHASGEHVVSLVNDLLDLSKIAAGKLDLSFGSVDVNGLVAEGVAMIQPQANAGKVIVRSQLAQDLPSVVADERSIRQIMLNLLSNAAKFTEAGGQVVASTSLTERGEVVIRVRDTGIGMADEDVKRAMEPFRQIPGPRAGGGTGLGLPLTKALVEANRAVFSILSEKSRGTLVEVVFPSTRVLAE